MNKITNSIKNSSLVQALFSLRMLIVFLLGFSGGLPLALTGGTLTLWISQAGASVENVGLFALVTMPYGLKVFWSPLVDRFFFSKFGRRKSWLLISQIGLIACLVGMAMSNPATSLMTVAVLALLTAFMSATQDIVIDAHRVESLSVEEQGVGSSLYVTGYRMGMLTSNAGALFIAGFYSWETAYLIMAAAAGIGVIATLIGKEPKELAAAPKTLKESVIEPLKEMLTRSGAHWILIFILLYKAGDIMASQVTSKLYTEKGYLPEEIASIVKIFGIWAIVAGSFIGGGLMLKLRLKYSLLIFGILQAASTAGFALLAQSEKSLAMLTGVIAFENFTGGMGTAAFVAFMARHANRKFTATQYALMTSLMNLPRSFLAAPTGFIVAAVGWQSFFIFCALFAIPGLLIIFQMRDLNENNSDQSKGIGSTPAKAASVG